MNNNFNFKKSLTVKNMVDVYKSANANMNEVWNTYLIMYQLGFITEKMWNEFYMKCKSMEWDNSIGMVVDTLL